MPSFEGILPVNKPIGRTSFNLVSSLRKLTNSKTIGHVGTLRSLCQWCNDSSHRQALY